MNRRELLGCVGAIGASASIGAGGSPADGHGPAAVNTHSAPLSNLHLHFCGIHIAKKDPNIQMITQHYCGPLSGGMHQCLLYDSTEKQAKLIGIEYIISDETFRALPDAEKKYWHPHTYEVLAGGLIAPSMKPDDELAFMKAMLTTWGKTWHTWPDPRTPVPMGEPMLMWSLTGDGQGDAEVLARRDRQFRVDTAKIREQRMEAIGFDVPDVPLPKSLDTIGRQWTSTGEDRPQPRKENRPRRRKK